MSYIASWSGGKDSCFACYRAILDGYDVSHLVNFTSKEHKKVSFHGTETKLIQLQAKAIGIPLLQKETTWDSYEEDFKDAVRSLIPTGIKGMIFGDLYLEEHKEWTERICGELGIESIEPLWGEKLEENLIEFIDLGFEATIVSLNADVLDKKWIGHKVDKEFVAYLKENDIDVCGENGEYHTLVTDGPIFKKKIEVVQGEPFTRDGYWFLNTVKYHLQEK